MLTVGRLHSNHLLGKTAKPIRRPKSLQMGQAILSLPEACPSCHGVIVVVQQRRQLSMTKLLRDSHDWRRWTTNSEIYTAKYDTLRVWQAFKICIYLEPWFSSLDTDLSLRYCQSVRSWFYHYLKSDLRSYSRPNVRFAWEKTPSCSRPQWIFSYWWPPHSPLFSSHAVV